MVHVLQDSSNYRVYWSERSRRIFRISVENGRASTSTHLKLGSNDLAVTRPLADTPVEALLASLRSSKGQKVSMLSHESTQPAPYAPESFVVEVFAELDPDTIQKRWQHVNVVLRLSMLTGLQMQLDATLNLLCDMATEIATCEKSLVYFWDEGHEQMELRLVRGIEKKESVVREVSAGNVMNLWVVQYGRPLLISRGHHRQADSLLEMMDAASALVVPLFVSNRVVGSLQFFAANAESFQREDAQLLWIMSLVAENLLTRESANEGLIRFAFTDYLTGLKTRGYFEQQLELEFKRAERRRQKFALLMIDIDHFKRLNDTFGHHVGDQMLRDVTSILMKDMREVDTVARYGGEEFVIILPETTESGAVYVAQRLRRAVEQAKFFAGSPHKIQHLTISIGVAVYDTDAQFKRDLIEFADAAMYAAKHKGRNRVVSYSEINKGDQKEVS